MKKGDEIIWHSGYGYDYGIYLEDSEFQQYNTCRIKLTTGNLLVETLRSKDEVMLKTKENVEKMKKKYNY